MNTTHTSLKLSKLLAENGCELESDYSWKPSTEALTRVGDKVMVVDDPNLWELVRIIMASDQIPIVPAYDILNDLCVRYAKEMFGEEICDDCGLCGGYSGVIAYESFSAEILCLLQQGKRDEAEDLIWLHCLFNPKNR